MNFTRSALILAACAALGTGMASAETWKSIGTGLYRDNFLSFQYAIADFPEVEVEIEESEETPGRYRLVNPYANYPAETIGSPGCMSGNFYLIVDASDPAHVFVEAGPTGFIYGYNPETNQNRQLVVNSMAYDYYRKNGNWIAADREGLCGKIVDKAITFPPNVLLMSGLDVDLEFDQDDATWAYVDSKAMFRVKLPGAPDLDITGSFVSINEAKTQLNFNITLGADVEKALVALVPGDNYNGDAHEAVINGEVDSLEINASGAVSLPYTADGIYTLTVVPYLEGTPRTPFFRTMEFAYSEAEWRKAGQALFTETIMSSNDMRRNGFVVPEYTYYVDVEESVATPGLIRLVDPYGDAWPGSYGYNYDESHHHYLVIDATNPDFVMIEKMSPIGINYGYGNMAIWSRTHRLMDDNDPAYIMLWANAWALQHPDWTEEQIDEEIYKLALENAGTFKDNEITFPVGGIVLEFSLANPGTWYDANNNGNFSIKFEEGQINGKQSTGIASVADDSNAPVEYYRLDGTRANASELTQGLYIVRQGSKSSKIVIR